MRWDKREKEKREREYRPKMGENEHWNEKERPKILDNGAYQFWKFI